jgi:hypothetical protein
MGGPRQGGPRHAASTSVASIWRELTQGAQGTQGMSRVQGSGHLSTSGSGL